jgi:hypothetical protein
VETAYDRGWAVLTNGALLRIAEETGFDAIITTDKGIRHQQNLGGRKLAIVVLSTNDWTRIRHSTSLVLEAISGLRRGSLIEVEIPR